MGSINYSMRKIVKNLTVGMAISMYIYAIFALTQVVLITQDNQDNLNDMSSRLNALQKKVDKPIAIRYSSIHHIEQWLGSHLK